MPAARHTVYLGIKAGSTDVVYKRAKSSKRMATYCGETTKSVFSECGCIPYETGQIRVSGVFWSSLFDVVNKRYNAV